MKTKVVNGLPIPIIVVAKNNPLELMMVSTTAASGGGAPGVELIKSNTEMALSKSFVTPP